MWQSAATIVGDKENHHQHHQQAQRQTYLVPHTASAVIDIRHILSPFLHRTKYSISYPQNHLEQKVEHRSSLHHCPTLMSIKLFAIGVDELALIADRSLDMLP